MDVLKLFKETGALLEGHFVLSSGLHSGEYLQCALLLQHPEHAERLCRELAKKFLNKKIDIVIAPALGGVLVSYELARALGVRSLFTERKDGKMQLRRNFKIEKGANVLVCEDVVTTGSSTREVIDIVKANGANVAGVACIIDRSGKENLFKDIMLYSLAKADIKTYTDKQCPLCKSGLSITKPGSKQA
ncbi:MAG: orotate phosphoribosyltransferase [Candidatus Omnitrophica bacterium]|nr:orotate phosphoribosyltransferase [Candidatus Omnitrophota bacterium]